MFRAFVAAALAAAVFAAPAVADRAAKPAEKRQIAKAMRASVVGGGIPDRWYTIDRQRISTASSSWAMAWQRSTKAGEGKFQPAYALLVKLAGTKRWVVVDLGTALVGCGVAPDKVVADLVGPCPPEERIG